MHYSNFPSRSRPARAAAAAPAATTLSLETDRRGTHLRVRKIATLARRALRPVAAATVAMAASAQAQFTIQPLTEATSKDTKIYGSVPTSNFSSNLNIVSLDVGAHFLSLVQFDLSALPFPSSEITQAFITLYVTGLGASGGPAAGGDVTLSPILDDWRETAADPGPAPLATYDAFFGTTPTLDLGSVAATQTIAGVGFVDWDVTSLVQSWAADPSSNHGVLIQLATGGGDIGIADVDSTPGVAGSAPKLTVVPEPGTAAALLGGAGVLLARRRRVSRS
jgi:hypothetical protein